MEWRYLAKREDERPHRSPGGRLARAQPEQLIAGSMLSRVDAVPDNSFFAERLGSRQPEQTLTSTTRLPSARTRIGVC